MSAGIQLFPSPTTRTLPSCDRLGNSADICVRVAKKSNEEYRARGLTAAYFRRRVCDGLCLYAKITMGIFTLIYLFIAVLWNHIRYSRTADSVKESLILWRQK